MWAWRFEIWLGSKTYLGQRRTCRVGLNRVYTVFWQVFYHVYCNLRCIYTVLANVSGLLSRHQPAQRPTSSILQGTWVRELFVSHFFLLKGLTWLPCIVRLAWRLQQKLPLFLLLTITLDCARARTGAWSGSLATWGSLDSCSRICCCLSCCRQPDTFQTSLWLSATGRVWVGGREGVYVCSSHQEL